jgi:hypothetical protein
MENESASKLIDQLISDPQLRADFRADPEGALTRSGVELSEEQRKALASEDWKQVPDQELGQRVSKATRWG